MAPLDATALAPVSDDQPAGDDLELDPEFGELERAAQGKPETQYGNTIEPAVPPDWKLTAATAQSLLSRTHDLRILVHLAIARLHLTGIIGFAEVIATIRREVETQWAHVHPKLDPDDDNDPMQRANALLRLRDPALVLRPMRDIALVSTPRTGPVAWRDLAVLNGTLEAEPDRPKLTEAVVQGAFRDGDQDKIAAVRDALETLLADVPGIEGSFDRQAGPGHAPDYASLVKLLADMHREMVRYQAAPQDDAPADDADPSSADAAPRPAGGGRAFASIQAINALSRREEALHALELAASYFRTQEPSSPLPLLIDRAKRLAGMEFMDILRDLAPDGLSQAQLVTGSTNE